MKWLSTNGYELPQKALDPVKEYVTRHWTFVACKIADSDPNTAEGLKTGTLAPLSMTFRTARPVYPLRMSANSKPFDLLVYVILPVPTGYWHRLIPERQQRGAYMPFSYDDLFRGARKP